MEKIKRINLDVALFLRDLNTYIETVNEIDHETIDLLTKAIIAIDRLQIQSKFRETSSPNPNNFALNLNNEIFECRRYIICRLCHENIPLSCEDFESHIRKESHKQNEINLRSKHNPIVNEYTLSPKVSMESTHSSHRPSPESGWSRNVLTSESPNPSTLPGDCSDKFASNERNTLAKLEDAINLEDITGAIASGMIDIIPRTEARVRDEKKIFSLLARNLKVFDSNLKINPVGSSTYGIGGIKTNFNILIQTEENPVVVLHSVGKLFKAGEFQTEFDSIPASFSNFMEKSTSQIII